MNAVQSRVHEQIGSLLVANIEQAVLIEKQAAEIDSLRAEVSKLKPLQPAAEAAPTADSAVAPPMGQST